MTSHLCNIFEYSLVMICSATRHRTVFPFILRSVRFFRTVRHAIANIIVSLSHPLRVWLQFCHTLPSEVCPCHTLPCHTLSLNCFFVNRWFSGFCHACHTLRFRLGSCHTLPSHTSPGTAEDTMSAANLGPLANLGFGLAGCLCLWSCLRYC